MVERNTESEKFYGFLNDLIKGIGYLILLFIIVGFLISGTGGIIVVVLGFVIWLVLKKYSNK